MKTAEESFLNSVPALYGRKVIQLHLNRVQQILEPLRQILPGNLSQLKHQHLYKGRAGGEGQRRTSKTGVARVTSINFTADIFLAPPHQQHSSRAFSTLRLSGSIVGRAGKTIIQCDDEMIIWTQISGEPQSRGVVVRCEFQARKIIIINKARANTPFSPRTRQRGGELARLLQERDEGQVCLVMEISTSGDQRDLRVS